MKPLFYKSYLGVYFIVSPYGKGQILMSASSLAHLVTVNPYHLQFHIYVTDISY